MILAKGFMYECVSACTDVSTQNSISCLWNKVSLEWPFWIIIIIIKKKTTLISILKVYNFHVINCNMVVNIQNEHICSLENYVKFNRRWTSSISLWNAIIFYGVSKT